MLILLPAGWSSECLLEWDSFTSLAIPSMLMMCIEWWTYEIGSFLIGQWSCQDMARLEPEQQPQAALTPPVPQGC